ncbi:hypothetical protein L0F63_006678 [Massospora cicadina]|nr:hypothetical protein L0F63_006678 [Massospora cicadina]
MLVQIAPDYWPSVLSGSCQLLADSLQLYLDFVDDCTDISLFYLSSVFVSYLVYFDI